MYSFVCEDKEKEILREILKLVKSILYAFAYFILLLRVLLR